LAEIKFISKDGIAYKGEFRDIIELSKKQRIKLKELASRMTSNDIEKRGLELEPEKWQEKVILEKIHEIAGHKKDICKDLMDWVRKVIQDRIVLFSSHAINDRMPDPSRNCTQMETAIIRLITVVQIQKFKAKVIPGTKEFRPRFTYTTESRIENGKLAISFSEEKNILIITILS
jgi:hypothetical protein